MGATVEKVTLAYSVITEFDSLTSGISVPCFHLCSMPGIGTIFSGTQAVATTRARPGRCPSTGPALRASGPAPTWRRSGQADRWGWGADRALSGRGGQGEGLGEGETQSRLPLPPRGVRKRSRRGCRRVRAALLTTRRTWKAAAPENPRSLTVRPVPGTEAIQAKRALASNTATRQKPSAPPSKL